MPPSPDFSVVVDSAVWAAREAFAEFGSVQPVPGSSVPADALATADALIVRSVTRIDAGLLDRAPRLRFVGSATAGIDHVDRSALASRGVEFAHAPGCNADAVCDWVTHAMMRARHSLPSVWGTGPVGVVGVGEVGRRVMARLSALGIEVLGCDPPRSERDGFDSVPLAELRRRCSILSFHVPWTRTGSHATHHMIAVDDEPLPALINTSRGAILDSRRLAQARPGSLILDVWEGEPELPWPMLARSGPVLFASPHVAGYSLEGKAAATTAVAHALAHWLGRIPRWGAGATLGRASVPPIELTQREFVSPMAAFIACLDACTTLDGDDQRLRDLAGMAEGSRAPGFEALRGGYSLRREFKAHQLSTATLDLLRTHLQTQLGFGQSCVLKTALDVVGITSGDLAG